MRSHPTISRICEQCGSAFDIPSFRVKAGGGRYCSRACANASRIDPRRLARPCAHCGVEFVPRTAQIKIGTGIYCSIACKNRAYSSSHRGELSPTWKGGARIYAKKTVPRVCEQCGGQFEASFYALACGRARYCSRSCAMRARGLEKHPRWKGGPVRRICAHCGEVFETTQARIADGRGLFCSKQCSDRGHTADHHARWKGGTHHYYGPNWGEQRRAARERDGHRCQECGRGRGELPRAVDVHHIIAFRTFGVERYQEANALANLVCLCLSCHQKREHRERAALNAGP